VTDVRDDATGSARDPRGAPRPDLDDLLTRWGSDQTGPWSRRATRSGGRHAAPEPATSGDEPGRFGAPGADRSGHGGWPQPPVGPVPAHRPDHPSWPAGTPSSRWAPRPELTPPRSRPAAQPAPRRSEPASYRAEPLRAEPPGYESPGYGPPGYEPPRAARSGEDTGRRHRPDGTPPPWATGAAPNGVGAATPVADLAGMPRRPAPPGPLRPEGTGAYAARLSGPAGAEGAPGIHAALSAGPYQSRSPAGLQAGPASAVGLLERTPDRYGLLTHDLDFPPEPAAADDDETPGRHRRLTGPARNRRPRWVRTLGLVGALLGILLLAGGGFAAYQYKKLSGNITRVDALAPGDGSIRDAAKQLDAENYLLIGSDSRAGENAAYGQVTGARSDTTILAHLSPKRDKAVLISFPRDSWVSLPACAKTDGGTEPAHDGQFNEAFSIGGPSCTVLAVQKLTGVKINHYVQVDFAGFKTMVDALDGVPICTTTPLRDQESGLRLPAGTSTLHGEQALAYVRARYGIGDGSDLGRIQRQQRFLGAMVRSATGTKLLVNPVALTKFLGAATKSLTLDRDTSFGDLKQLADQLHGLDPKKVSFLTAPIADAAYTPPGFPAPPPGRGGSRVLLDDVAGRTLYDSIINDRPATPKPAGAPTGSPKPNVLTVAPQDISVRVLNGVGIGQLGRKVSGDLRSVGFSTVEPSNAPATAVTTVRYGPDNKAAALTLAAAVPGAVLQPDASTDLDLVVGGNYTAVKTVRVGDPATAKAATAPKPTAAASTTPAVTAADARCD
jgi:LCP family protein required for cell wall assembly